MIDPAISFLIFLVGAISWKFNKMSCSNWYIGYFFVLVQGAGIGLLCEYGLSYIGVI